MIALFTGARTAEIAQLFVNEATIDDAIPVFNIQATEGRKLKNKFAPRQIPIHPMLLDLGFDEYVRRMKQSGQKRLFPLWTWSAGKKAADASSQRSFRRTIIPQISERTNPKPVFHSFRSTMKGEMVRVGMHEIRQNAILGHEQIGQTGTYLREIALPTLDEAMKSVTYSGVDFVPILRARGKKAATSKRSK